MEDNRDFDLDSVMDELSTRLEDIIENSIQDALESTLEDVLEDAIENALADQLEDAVTSAVQDIFEEALSTSLSRFEFALADGTIIKPKQRLKLLSPDKAKMLLCYGGLRVDGSSLIVQTGATWWDFIAFYKSREEAIEALAKVRDAMDAGVDTFEL